MELSGRYEAKRHRPRRSRRAAGGADTIQKGDILIWVNL